MNLLRESVHDANALHTEHVEVEAVQLSHLLVVAELIAEDLPSTAKDVETDDLGSCVPSLDFCKGTDLCQEVLHFF